MKYELYELLLENSKSNENELDVDFICNIINEIGKNMSKEESYKHYCEICALILHYEVINKSNFQKTKAPCKGKIMFGGKGIKYQFNNLPIELQKIINEYIIYYMTYE